MGIKVKNFLHECKVNYHTSLVVLNVHVPEFLGKVFSEKRWFNLFISEVFINYNRHEPIVNLCKHYHVKAPLRIPHWHSSTIFVHSSEIFYESSLLSVFYKQCFWHFPIRDLSTYIQITTKQHRLRWLLFWEDSWS